MRVEQISEADLPRIWTHPESLYSSLDRFVTDSIDSSIEGSVVEIAIRTADADGDWIAITVRDWAGGKPDGWSIDLSVQQLAKQLEGYIDITNHPGRGTICSLHLPTGNLSGWLCRQPQAALGYYASWDPQKLSVAGENGGYAKVDAIIQSSLKSNGSLVPSGKNAYLLASSSAIDKRALEATIASHLLTAFDIRDIREAMPVRVEYFGFMGEFMQRLESTIPTSTCDMGWDSVKSEMNPGIRIDTPDPQEHESVDGPKRSARSLPTGTRIRPRRARVI